MNCATDAAGSHRGGIERTRPLPRPVWSTFSSNDANDAGDGARRKNQWARPISARGAEQNFLDSGGYYFVDGVDSTRLSNRSGDSRKDDHPGCLSWGRPCSSSWTSVNW